MTKIIIAVVIIAAIAVGYLSFKPNTSPGVVPNDTASETSTPAPSGGKKMAFSQFVKQGGSYKCTVNQYLGEVGGSSTKGITYIDGGKIRGEYSTQTQGLSIDTTFIVRDGYSYTWTSMMPNTGFKSRVSTEVKAEGSAATSGTYSFNSEQIGDYDCEAWTSDASKFNIPTSVTFKEV